MIVRPLHAGLLTRFACHIASDKVTIPANPTNTVREGRRLMRMDEIKPTATQIVKKENRRVCGNSTMQAINIEEKLDERLSVRESAAIPESAGWARRRAYAIAGILTPVRRNATKRAVAPRKASAS
jgi:hypothetical protein